MQRSIYAILVGLCFGASAAAKRGPALEWAEVMQHVRHQTVLNLKDMGVSIQGARRLTPQKLPPFIAPLVGAGAVFHKNVERYALYAWAPLSKLPPLFGEMRHHPVQRLGRTRLWTLDLEFETLRLFIIKGGVAPGSAVEDFGPLNPDTKMMDRKNVQALKKARRQAKRPPKPKIHVAAPKPASKPASKPAPDLKPTRVSRLESNAAQLARLKRQLTAFQARFVTQEEDWAHPLIKAHLGHYLSKMAQLLEPTSQPQRALKRLYTRHQEIKEQMRDIHQALEDTQAQAHKMAHRAARHQARVMDETRPLHRRVAHQESVRYYQHARLEKTKEFRALKAQYMKLKLERPNFYKKALAVLTGAVTPSE